jgi:hypothetical protein
LHLVEPSRAWSRQLYIFLPFRPVFRCWSKHPSLSNTSPVLNAIEGMFFRKIFIAEDWYCYAGIRCKPIVLKDVQKRWSHWCYPCMYKAYKMNILYWLSKKLILCVNINILYGSGLKGMDRSTLFTYNLRFYVPTLIVE